MEEQRIGSLKFNIDFSQPLHEQILEQVRSSIAKGEIGLGEKMPSVRELAQELRMNPNTVMRAYQELERDGLTEKRRGQGTYVTSSSAHVQQFRADLAAKYIIQFLAQMHALGLTDNEVIACIRQKFSSEPQADQLAEQETRQGGNAR